MHHPVSSPVSPLEVLRGRTHIVAMSNLLSLAIGLVAFLLALIAFIPPLGAANWLIVPLALIGLVIGLMSPARSGRTLNLVVIIIGIVRLMLGGGLF
jgi:hypothetical protein